MLSVFKSYERHLPAHADILRSVAHKMRERKQSIAGDVERDNSCMVPGNSPSNSQMQFWRQNLVIKSSYRRRPVLKNMPN